MKKWGGQLDIRPPHSKNWGGRVPPIPPRIDAPGVSFDLHPRVSKTSNPCFQNNNCFNSHISIEPKVCLTYLRYVIII